MDGLKLNPRNTRAQVDLCQLKLDYQIFWHAEHEILFTQEHVLNVLIKVTQFLIASRDAEIPLARTEVSSSNILLNDKCIPIMAS